MKCKEFMDILGSDRPSLRLMSKHSNIWKAFRKSVVRKDRRGMKYWDGQLKKVLNQVEKREEYLARKFGLGSMDNARKIFSEERKYK